MLKATIEYVLKLIVDEQASVVVDEQVDQDKLLVSISVATKDMARVIGKEGRTIKALRKLAKFLAPVDKEITIDIK